MKHDALHVPAPRLPEHDRSGEIGKRLLRLMAVRGRAAMRWYAATRNAGPDPSRFAISDTRGKDVWPLHVMYEACTLSQLLTILARCAGDDRLPPGHSRHAMLNAAADMLRAAVATHPRAGSGAERPDFWSGHAELRLAHLIGLPAWLAWEHLDGETRTRLVAIFEHEADRWIGRPAPAQLYDDTQAETNAWMAGGLAIICAMLPHHPRRPRWLDKTYELMITAYAGPADLADARPVQGRPLKDWLTGPNAFDDGAVENHGFVHPDYIAAISEKVRSAIAFALAGESVPEAVTLHADRVMSLLMKLNLPDANHLYLQGSDYGSRRIDSFFQACGVLALRPDPLLQACFLRNLDRIETMMSHRPTLNASGWLDLPYDFGVTWGLCENYLMRRIFGDGGPALPEAEVEPRLAGVHCNEAARFILHRTPRTLSVLSWHGACPDTNATAMTFPLDRDVICSALPMRGYLGKVAVDGEPAAPPHVIWNRVRPGHDGFAAMLALEWARGAVRQQSAFFSLPNGVSIYLEERAACRPLRLTLAQSGTIAVYDDPRWPWQPAPRRLVDALGPFDAAMDLARDSAWLNVDDRLGYAALGAGRWRFTPGSEQWKTWLIGLEGETNPTREFQIGDTLSTIAVVTMPHATAPQTRAAAEGLAANGWVRRGHNALAIRWDGRLVYAVFGPAHERFQLDGRWVELPPHEAGVR